MHFPTQIYGFKPHFPTTLLFLAIVLRFYRHAVRNAFGLTLMKGDEGIELAKVGPD